MKPAHKALKDAFGEVIGGVGTIEAAELFCRVGRSTLQTYYSGSDKHAEVFAPLDVVADLEVLARDRVPRVTELLCRLNGGVFMRLPDAKPGSGDVLKTFGVMTREYGQDSNVILAAASDGQVTQAEAAEALKKHDEFLAVAMTVRALLAALAGAG